MNFNSLLNLRSRGLLEARLLLHAQKANGLQQAQGAHGIHIGRVFGRLETHRHMRLRAKIVDLVGLNLGHDAGQVGTVRQIPIVQLQPLLIAVRVLVDVVAPLGIEGRSPAFDAVNLVPFLQQKLG